MNSGTYSPLSHLLLAGLASAAILAACGDDIRKKPGNPNPQVNNASSNNPSFNNPSSNNPSFNNPSTNNPNPDNSCLGDEDCDFGFVCQSELCLQSCSSSANCPVGSECVLRNGAGTCNPTVSNQSLRHVLITDTTDVTNQAGCTALQDGDAEPGSDIAVVVLKDSEGVILGYGQAVNSFAGSEPEGNDFPGVYIVLDGSAPTTADRCPDNFGPDTVASLGCGGAVLLQFVDGVNTPIGIPDRSLIQVVEYGANCGGTSDDTLRISLCTDTAGAALGSTTSCTVTITEGSGAVFGEVRLP